MIKCSLISALRDCVFDSIDSYGKPKDNGLDYFVLTLTKESAFNTIKKALADAKGEAYAKNDSKTAVFVFFKPLDRKNANESEIPAKIQKVFRQAHDFGVPENDDIVEIKVKDWSYWAVKLEFK